MNEIKNLLEKVKILNFKYEQIIKHSRHDFNIFSVLFREHDEVNLHSRFLFELLNPNGGHHQGEAFLSLFLQQLEMSAEEFSLDNVFARREYQNIDILITNQRQALIIENKIYAGDQPRQLERYYKVLTRKGFEQISIIYLTLDGHEPGSDSIGELNRDLIRSSSYKVDITNWLDNCIQIAARQPTLRETLIQYQALIKKLTGQSMIKGYIMEIKDLLLQDNNLQLVLDIEEAITEAKIEIQLRFWEALETALVSKGYQINNRNKYTHQKIQNFYRGARNRRYYGLMIDLGMSQEKDQLYFYVEIETKLYYGFTIANSEGSRKIAKEPRFDALVQNLGGMIQLRLSRSNF